MSDDTRHESDGDLMQRAFTDVAAKLELFRRGYVYDVASGWRLAGPQPRQGAFVPPDDGGGRGVHWPHDLLGGECYSMDGSGTVTHVKVDEKAGPQR